MVMSGVPRWYRLRDGAWQLYWASSRESPGDRSWSRSVQVVRSQTNVGAGQLRGEIDPIWPACRRDWPGIDRCFVMSTAFVLVWANFGMLWATQGGGTNKYLGRLLTNAALREPHGQVAPLRSLPRHRSTEELDAFALLAKLRREGFTCPGGQRFEPNSAEFDFDCRLWRAAHEHSADMAARSYYAMRTHGLGVSGG